MEGLTVFVLAGILGCALAAPAPEPCITPPPPSKCTPNNFMGFYLSVYEKFEYEYYSREMCASVGIPQIPPYIPTIYFDDFNNMILQAQCQWINSISSRYPKNYLPMLPKMPKEQLTFDVILLFATPGTLSMLPYLIDQGLSIAIVDTGFFAPPQSSSPYYRASLLNSPFVRRIPMQIPGRSSPLCYYSPKVFGGASMYDIPKWQHGSKNFYDQMSKINSCFSYDNVKSRFQQIEYTKTTVESSTSIQSSSCGYSISTSFKETSISISINSLWSDMGYSGGITPLGDDYVQGLSYVPSFEYEGQFKLYTEEIFSRLSSLDKVFTFAGVRINKIIFDYKYGFVKGVEICTEFGNFILTANCQVIMGGSTIDMFEIMHRSGIGSLEYMNKFGITPFLDMPSLGNQVRFTPNYVNPIMCFPQGALIQEYVSDYTMMDFAFGSSSQNSVTSLSNYNAYYSVGGSKNINVVYSFFAFSRYTTLRIKYILQHYCQLDIVYVEYVIQLCLKYDVLFIVTTLLETQSYGSLYFGGSLEEVMIRGGMYTQEQDLFYMVEAVQYLEALMKTSTFTNMGAQSMYLSSVGPSPVTGNFYTPKNIRNTLTNFSFPSLYSYGGVPMGSSFPESCITPDFSFHKIPNLMCVGPAISPYSIQGNAFGFSTLTSNLAYEIFSKQYQSDYYEKMRQGVFYTGGFTNMGGINTGIGGIDTGIGGMGTGTRSIDTGIGGFDSCIEGTTISGGSIGGLDTLSIAEESMYEAEMSSRAMGAVGGGYDISSSGLKTLGGGMGVSTVEKEIMETEAKSSMSSASGIGGIGGGYSSMQASEASYEMESSSTMIAGGGSGAMIASSAYEVEAESSSMVSSSGGVCGGSSFSSYEEQVEAACSSTVVAC